MFKKFGSFDDVFFYIKSFESKSEYAFNTFNALQLKKISI